MSQGRPKQFHLSRHQVAEVLMSQKKKPVVRKLSDQEVAALRAMSGATPEKRGVVSKLKGIFGYA